ncbi:MAG: hypothetical protein ND866_24205, partial [Pyrinomonadaceae bacterium]|nr:hypothetical protein [Pyrinomonadaceae bacterium]
YFYDNKAWVEGDVASLNEVKALAELMLNNFASAMIHSAVFPDIRSAVTQDETIAAVADAPFGADLMRRKKSQNRKPDSAVGLKISALATN